MNLEAMFEGNDKEFLKFDRIEKPLHHRPDICAFLMLDSILPPEVKDRDMVSGARHDVIYLDVDCEALAKVITDEQVRDLSRCGVLYDCDTDSLSMFV